MSLSQMQIGCLPGSQMGLMPMQRETVGVGAGVEATVPTMNAAAVPNISVVRIVLRMSASLCARRNVALERVAWCYGLRFSSPRG